MQKKKKKNTLSRIIDKGAQQKLNNREKKKKRSKNTRKIKSGEECWISVADVMQLLYLVYYSTHKSTDLKKKKRVLRSTKKEENKNQKGLKHKHTTRAKANNKRTRTNCGTYFVQQTHATYGITVEHHKTRNSIKKGVFFFPTGEKQNKYIYIQREREANHKKKRSNTTAESRQARLRFSFGTDCSLELGVTQHD